MSDSALPSPRSKTAALLAQRASNRGKKAFVLPKDDYTSVWLSSSVIAPESKRIARESEHSDSGRYSSDDNQGSNTSILITDGATTSIQTPGGASTALPNGYLMQQASTSSDKDSPRYL